MFIPVSEATCGGSDAAPGDKALLVCGLCVRVEHAQRWLRYYDAL